MILDERKKHDKKQLNSPFNKALKGLLSVPPPKDENK